MAVADILWTLGLGEGAGAGGGEIRRRVRGPCFLSKCRQPLLWEGCWVWVAVVAMVAMVGKTSVVLRHLGEIMLRQL